MIIFYIFLIISNTVFIRKILSSQEFPFIHFLRKLTNCMHSLLSNGYFQFFQFYISVPKKPTRKCIFFLFFFLIQFFFISFFLFLIHLHSLISEQNKATFSENLLHFSFLINMFLGEPITDNK